MTTQDKRNPKNWTKEKKDNVVSVFTWLIKENKKQNTDLYKRQNNNEKKK